MHIGICISNKTLRRVVARFLEKLNHRVAVIDDAAAGCAEVPVMQRFDCLLLEQTCSSPVGELMRLRERGEFLDTPAIILAAYGSVLTYPEAKALGIYGYLHSPVELSELELMLTHFSD